MTCTELQSRLPGYARGVMSAEEEAAFEAHLGSCAECAAIVALAEPELNRVEALPRAIVPAEDLWPAIQARIDSKTTQRRVVMPRWLLAAAVIALVVGSSVVTTMLLRTPSRPAARGTTRLIGLEAEYSTASEDLSAALNAARNRLAPETITTIERNLAVIDSALAESRRALAGDPGNSVLEQLVVAAWRQKVDLLRRATALSGKT